MKRKEIKKAIRFIPVVGFFGSYPNGNVIGDFYYWYQTFCLLVLFFYSLSWWL